MIVIALEVVLAYLLFIFLEIKIDMRKFKNERVARFYIFCSFFEK